MQFKDYILEKKEIVEITDSNHTSKEIENAWTEYLEYKGDNIYDFYIDFLEWFENNTQSLEDSSWDEDISREKQEAYLGYIPSKDVFVTGYDMWVGGDTASGIVYWTYSKGKFKIKKEYIDSSSNMMYGPSGGYKKLHKVRDDLIDIRLD